MQKIAIFGKGGIGKSTFSSNLAAIYARRGLRVLLVGCDPKHDTTVALTEGAPIRTAVEHSAFMDSGKTDAAGLVVRGRLGVDCVEAGGPEPGIGCAGRGISRMIEILEEAGFLEADRYDVALFDVLGDVVCGGFAAPLRENLADKVLIVTSEELMSLYAANNVARAVRNYAANGSSLVGLAANLRDPDADREAVARFAGLIGTRVVAWLTRDPAVRRAEYARKTAVEIAPESGFALSMESLASELLKPSATTIPTPLSDESFQVLARGAFAGAPPVPAPAGAEPGALPADASHPPEDRSREKSVDRGHGLLEKALARLNSSKVRETGSNADQWGAADQWRQFFCDRESRRNAQTGLRFQAPVLQIWHQDLECGFATPAWDRPEPAYFNFPWLRRSRRRDGDHPPSGEDLPRSLSLTTDLRDSDVIRGGERKLREVLEAGLEAAGDVQAVVIQSTCVPTVIGDDVSKVILSVEANSRVPFIHSNPAANQGVDVGRLMLERLRAEKDYARQEGIPGSVNLVGFPEGPGMAEIEDLLERAGVRVNARVMPGLSPAQARRLPRAAAQVYCPNAAYEPVYEQIFRTIPVPGHVFEPPFGVEATRRWLRAAAGLFGREAEADRVFEESFAPLEGKWKELRRRALGKTFAFVVDGAQLPRLTEPSLLWGVPVLRMLREMGIRAEVLLHGGKSRGPLKGFETPGELDRLLREGPYDAVYSEFFFDERLVRAGKTQFSLAAFEPGVRGAATTLERLLAVGRWDFYKRYAPYLRGVPT
ncbi:MAG: nitrogenase component 1 [Elusimicrobiota bacterium]